MNIDNMNILINAVRDGIPGVQFSMDDFLARDESCMTAACIAGHAAILWNEGVVPLWNEDVVPEFAGVDALVAYLGISYEDALSIAIPKLNRSYDATSEQAARLLEMYRDTGKIDWRRALRGDER